MKEKGVLDVAVVGGGPAGISACLEIVKWSSSLRIMLFEYEEALGGIPRSCHSLFGFHDRGRLYTGPGYASALDRLVRKSPISIQTASKVTSLNPGCAGQPHTIQVLSGSGFRTYLARSILIATGCFESSRAFRNIGGTRPSGILTTGELQQIVGSGRPVGRRAVVVGTEHIAFSSVLTLRRSGLQIKAMIENDDSLQTYSVVGNSLSRYGRFPIYLGSSVDAILGEKRVEGVVLRGIKDSTRLTILCDTVVITGKFQPYSGLLNGTGIEIDSATLGPAVNMEYETSVRNVFAAGNVLRGADMHGFCALEGKNAAKGILSRLERDMTPRGDEIRISAEPPIRYVVPQRLLLTRVKRDPFYWVKPGCCFQMERTMLSPTVEAWSGTNRVWKRSYGKLIANQRVALPLHRFDWQGVKEKLGITISISK